MFMYFFESLFLHRIIRVAYFTPCLHLCLTVYLSACLSLFLSFCMSVFLSVCYSAGLHVCLSVCLCVCMSVCVCIYICLFFCLFVIFSFSVLDFLAVCLNKLNMSKSIDYNCLNTVGLLMLPCCYQVGW